MNVRRRIYMAYLLGFPALVIALGLALLVHPKFLVLVFAVQFGLGIYVIMRKCPQCGKAVLNNPITLFGTTMYIWTGRVPAHCSRCGASLTGADFGGSKDPRH